MCSTWYECLFLRVSVFVLSCRLSYDGRTPTASRQASRHETKDAVLLHSWFRLKSAHRSSTCLRLITSSLIDDMTSSSEEDTLIHWCCSFSTDVWVLTHRKGICRVLLHVSAAWSWSQHHDSDRWAAVFIISFVSTVFLSLRHVADIVSWRMLVCGLAYCGRCCVWICSYVELCTIFVS
jgi:hypothetical protein